MKSEESATYPDHTADQRIRKSGIMWLPVAKQSSNLLYVVHTKLPVSDQATLQPRICIVKVIFFNWKIQDNLGSIVAVRFLYDEGGFEAYMCTKIKVSILFRCLSEFSSVDSFTPLKNKFGSATLI